MTLRPIEAIYLLTHKYYLRLTRICVASIRYWYPDIPIYLIKDKVAGDFSTKEIEQAWNVRVFETPTSSFGWGFAHLEPMLSPDGQRALIIDVDIAFVGPVLEVLDKYAEDMIVQREDQPENPPERFNNLYFSLDKIRAYDPEFVFPRYSFNAGQLVVTTGVFKRDDFEGLINWTMPRTTVIPEIFGRGDQGVLNYVTMKKEQRNELTLARIPFMVWNPEEMKKFELSRITPASPYRELIHWAGLRMPRMRDMPRADILFKFEQLYYSRVPRGSARLASRIAMGRVMNLINKARSRLTGGYPILYLT
jgi:hypothetical protein